MAEALPTHHHGDDSSDLASSYEAIALLIHAYLAALDFRLCGFDEDKLLRMFHVYFISLCPFSRSPSPHLLAPPPFLLPSPKPTTPPLASSIYTQLIADPTLVSLVCPKNSRMRISCSAAAAAVELGVWLP